MTSNTMICNLNNVNSGESLGLTHRVHKLNGLRVFYQASYCVSNKIKVTYPKIIMFAVFIIFDR